MLERFWDFFVDTMIFLFMPLVCSYLNLSSNIFLTVSTKEASGVERLANSLLSPVQYLLVGEEASLRENGSWHLEPRFDYREHFWLKTTTSALSAAPSFILGTTLKAISLLEIETRQKYRSIQKNFTKEGIENHLAYYESIGIRAQEIGGFFTHCGLLRERGAEHIFSLEKEALKEIGKALNAAKIPWWVDCGTCLGAYRYGGVIPWDQDIDIAVLLPDFENVQRALLSLDPQKYIVQNWSSRDFPKSYLKVFIRESGNLIDIYHFDILPQTKKLQYLLALENNIFFPKWWKIRERHYKTPVAFDAVFPLKKALFDGIEVFVPNDTKTYLQRYYGEDLSPPKIYNPKTGQYEKDPTHPYWKTSHAH